MPQTSNQNTGHCEYPSTVCRFRFRAIQAKPIMQKARTTGINAALFSAFFLGLAPVFGKAAMGVGKFSTYAVVALRTGLAAMLLFVLMGLFKRRFLYIYPAGLIGCAMAGAVNGIGSVFYYVGLSKINSSVAKML